MCPYLGLQMLFRLRLQKLLMNYDYDKLPALGKQTKFSTGVTFVYFVSHNLSKLDRKNRMLQVMDTWAERFSQSQHITAYMCKHTDRFFIVSSFMSIRNLLKTRQKSCAFRGKRITAS